MKRLIPDPKLPPLTLPPERLLWLLAALTLVILPHVPRLPWWVTGLIAASGGLRLLAAVRNRPLPGRWLLLLFTLAATIGIYLSYGTLFGRNAAITLLVTMLALKLFETRSHRDLMVITFLAYFVVITHFLSDQSIFTALYLLAAVIAVTAVVLDSNHYAAPFRPAVKLRLATILTLQAVPLTIVLFLLFPRISSPLWGLPEDSLRSRTGLSETMSPGNISELSQSDEVAFRVDFKGEPPARNQLYWRGQVLWEYDGRTWYPQRQRAVRIDPGRIETDSAPLNYSVILEPHDRHWMFALDLPISSTEGILTQDYLIQAKKPVRDRLRYEVTSILKYRAGYDADLGSLGYALQLPEDANPRTLALAQTWRREAGTDAAVVQRALAFFHQEPFVYTLSPPLLGDDPVDEFLFQTRRGFCEHYASAFTVLMRAAGIPARVIGGYQGGELNPLGEYLIVRQWDAHAWSEVWLEGRGWVRVDPTAAVAPERIETGLRAALPDTEPLPALLRIEGGWVHKLRLGWDAMNNAWNRWFLGYSADRQRELLSRLGFDTPGWRELAILLTTSAGIILAVSTALLLRRRRSQDPVVAAYERFCHKLARRGIRRGPSEGPADFARRAAAERPELGAKIKLINNLYTALRYGKRRPASWEKRLQRLVREFKP